MHGDARGYFYESFHAEKYKKAGLDLRFVQSNVSRSARGVLRGLHYQFPNPQGKLVNVLEGEVYDVAVDIRVGSPTFGRWAAAVLTADNKRHFWIPEGFAHGFAVLSEFATFSYQCTALVRTRSRCRHPLERRRQSRSTGRSARRCCRKRISARRFCAMCRTRSCPSTSLHKAARENPAARRQWSGRLRTGAFACAPG